MPRNTNNSVEPPIARRLDDFRADNPQKTLVVDSVEWRYRTAGRGATGLVMLPGSAGGGEAYFQLAERLADHFHCLLIDYPVADGLDQMLEGLDAILKTVGKQRYSIIGGSYGGMVAQALLLHDPQRVDRVVLNGTGAPSPERAKKNLRWQPVIRLIPISWLQALLRTAVRKMSKQITIDREFWTDYYCQAASSLSRAELDSKYRASIDFDRSFGSRLDQLDSWDGEVLITQGSSDKMAHASMQKAIRDAYPQATIHVFEGAGHGVSLERPDEWRAVVGDFLIGESEAGPRTDASQPISVASS